MSLSSIRVCIAIAPCPASGTKVSVSIDAKSIDTRNERRDSHLRSPNFFDVENHPKVEFASTKIVNIQKESFDLVGNLKIRGITKKLKSESLKLVLN